MRGTGTDHQRLRAVIALSFMAAAAVFWGCGGRAQNSEGNQGSEQRVESDATPASAVPAADAAQRPDASTSTDAVVPAPDVTQAASGDQPLQSAAPEEEKGAAGSLPELMPVDKRAPLPDLDMRDMNGRSVKSDDLRGKVVLLNFWATWCGPCRMEIPILVQLHDRYEDQGLRIVAPSIDRTGLGAVKPFMDKHPEIHYTVVPNGTPAAMAMGGVPSIPTSFLVDRHGRVIAKFVGLMRPEALEGYVKAALRERS